VNSFVSTLKQLGPVRLGIMGAVLAGLMVFFAFVSVHISSPGSMRLLYDNLSTMDSGAMAAKLDEAKIHYDVSSDGTRIMVPENEVGQARMLLAKDGLPNGGTMGYEIFDQQSGFGTTSFVQNINQVRALEGELSRTIDAVQGVRSARVHLVLPERELFSRENRPASASVFLALKPGVQLDRGNILAVQSLVASAVPSLRPQGVAIIDSHGNLLARGGGDDDEAAMPLKAEEMRHNYEQRLTNEIEDLVGRVVGYGHVHATVAADLNFDRVSTNQETYDPDGQVARSTQTVTDKNTERQVSSQEVSVQNNLPGIAGTSSGSAPTTEGNRSEETTNYEISKTVKSMVSDVGNLKRLSVAVLVDGNYAETKKKDDKGKETDQTVKAYQPRSQQELDKITALVKSAVGFDDKRGDTIDVSNMQFAEVDTGEAGANSNLLFGFDRSELLNAAEVLAVAILAVLVILLVVQPMIGRLLAVENMKSGGDARKGTPEMLPGRAAAPALAGPAPALEKPMAPEEDSLIDMSRVEGKVKASSVKKVEDIVDSYPAETVSVIRSWMTQET
jgi:flagellar M-ring protein FliF